MTLLRRFLALLVALALVTAAILVGIEAVGIRADRNPVLLPIDDWGENLASGDWGRWSADAWAIAAGATLALGLVLVVVQLIPQRVPTVERRHADGERVIRYGRKGMEARLRDLTIDQDGVLGGKVTTSKRTARVTALVPRGADGPTTERTVRTAVGQELDKLQLAKRPKVRVDATETADRVL
ncbi:DUF6286 domain-containing protein [Rhabdothermincola salaria]|uniref:DUF6286 domain-containing protein n=1 Tax=Rhabdothermincola salaria TaxID=2903142 RepID=UPI001E544BF6|nr:DUF6286 domain-containing protein [Rhabdothermincola salaria]MCD9623956.1 DUF6286 domain-containing protein [Rhabdothermincola salaria]